VGNIPVGPETQGARIVGAVGKRWLHVCGAGSVVTADVPPYTMVAGVPARVVREFGPDEVDSGA
jgi:serine acetyltransferase